MTNRESSPEEASSSPADESAADRPEAEAPAGSDKETNGHLDLSDQLEELEELIRESPLTAVGIAVGVGLVVGLILRRH